MRVAVVESVLNLVDLSFEAVGQVREGPRDLIEQLVHEVAGRAIHTGLITLCHRVGIEWRSSLRRVIDGEHRLAGGQNRDFPHPDGVGLRVQYRNEKQPDQVVVLDLHPAAPTLLHPAFQMLDLAVGELR